MALGYEDRQLVTARGHTRKALSARRSDDKGAVQFSPCNLIELRRTMPLVQPDDDIGKVLAEILDDRGKLAQKRKIVAPDIEFPRQTGRYRSRALDRLFELIFDLPTLVKKEPAFRSECHAS